MPGLVPVREIAGIGVIGRYAGPGGESTAWKNGTIEDT